MTQLTVAQTVRSFILCTFLLTIIIITSACAPASNDPGNAISALPAADEPAPTPTLVPTATAESDPYPVETATEVADVPIEVTESAETPPVETPPTMTPSITPTPLSTAIALPTEAPVLVDPADAVRSIVREQTLYLVEVREGGTATPIVGTDVSMTIDWEGGMVNGNAGCNQFGGTFSVTNGALTVGRLAATRMACDEAIMQIEQQMLMMLEMGTAIEIDATSAVISSSIGQLVFSPEPLGQSDLNSVGGGENSAETRSEEAPILAAVDSFDIALLESFPVQATMTVRGSFNDACWAISKVEQDVFQQEAIFVTLEMESFGEVCATVVTPFEEVIDLNIRGLKAGTYRVVVNGAEGTLELAVDNIVEE